MRRFFLRNPFGGKPIKEVNVKAACLNGYTVLDNGRFVEVNGNPCFGEVEVKSLYGDVLGLYKGPLHESEALTKLELWGADYSEWVGKIGLRRVENLYILTLSPVNFQPQYEFIVACGLKGLCFNGKTTLGQNIIIRYDDHWVLSNTKGDPSPNYGCFKEHEDAFVKANWLVELSDIRSDLTLNSLTSITGLFYPYDDRTKELLNINDVVTTEN